MANVRYPTKPEDVPEYLEYRFREMSDLPISTVHALNSLDTLRKWFGEQRVNQGFFDRRSLISRLGGWPGVKTVLEVVFLIKCAEQRAERRTTEQLKQRVWQDVNIASVTDELRLLWVLNELGYSATKLYEGNERTLDLQAQFLSPEFQIEVSSLSTPKSLRRAYKAHNTLLELCRNREGTLSVSFRLRPRAFSDTHIQDLEATVADALDKAKERGYAYVDRRHTIQLIAWGDGCWDRVESMHAKWGLGRHETSLGPVPPSTQAHRVRTKIEYKSSQAQNSYWVLMLHGHGAVMQDPDEPLMRELSYFVSERMYELPRLLACVIFDNWGFAGTPIPYARYETSDLVFLAGTEQGEQQRQRSIILKNHFSSHPHKEEVWAILEKAHARFGWKVPEEKFLRGESLSWGNPHLPFPPL